MKEILFIICIAMLFAMCKSAKTATGSAPEAEEKVKVQYKDDFRAASAKEKAALLKELKASAAKYSIVVFTQNFKGEKVTIANANSQLYSGYALSNLKTGIA